MKATQFCLLLAITLIAAAANAELIEFEPPDSVELGTTNSNDGWELGRGILFGIENDVTINAIGAFLDFSGLADVALSFKIAQILDPSALDVRVGQTEIVGGTVSVSTSGFEWIDIALDPVHFVVGNFYHIEFFHSVSSNNLYYEDLATWSQGSFTNLDGTLDGNPLNRAVPLIRVNTVQVTEPGTLALLCIGLAGIGFARRRRA